MLMNFNRISSYFIDCRKMANELQMNCIEKFDCLLKNPRLIANILQNVNKDSNTIHKKGEKAKLLFLAIIFTCLLKRN